MVDELFLEKATLANVRSPTANAGKRPLLIRLARSAAILLICWLLMSVVLVWLLTHRVSSPYAEPLPDQSRWGPYEECRLTTRDGLSIGAWWYPGDNKDQPVALLIHGNGANRGALLEAAHDFRCVGCGVLLLTARAHGDSEGSFNDIGYSAKLDVIAGVQWIKERSADRPIIIFGQSLGSAAGLFAAQELQNHVAGYILESPYRSLATAVNHRLSIYFPKFAIAPAQVSLIVGALLQGIDPNKISPIKAAKHVPANVPVLILAGALDDRAPLEEAKEIVAALGPKARIEAFANAAHLNAKFYEPDRYAKLLQSFVEQVSTGRALNRVP